MVIYEQSLMICHTLVADTTHLTAEIVRVGEKDCISICKILLVVLEIYMSRQVYYIRVDYPWNACTFLEQYPYIVRTEIFVQSSILQNLLDKFRVKLR